MDYFNDLIGQEPLKRKLAFYLDAYQATRRMPFLLFCGAKGLGKTRFMRDTASYIKGMDDKARSLLEINCSVIKNNQMFFENIFLTFLHENDVTVAFDEAHNLPKDLAQAFLTICNTEKDPVRDFRYGDSSYRFNFHRLTFMFATTEPDKLFPPLKDRFDYVDFQPYTVEELKQMVKLYSDDLVNFHEDVIDEIADHLRGNARSCVKMAEHIVTYCKKNRTVDFGRKDWKALCFDLSIQPYGLTNSEISILRELNTRGACSLNMLASATGLSRSAIQRDVEQYLLLKDFMRIDGKRKITDKGQNALAKLAT